MLGRNVTNNTHIESKTKFRSSVKPKPRCENICFNLLGVSDGWGYLHQNNISKQKRLKLTEISPLRLKNLWILHFPKCNLVALLNKTFWRLSSLQTTDMFKCICVVHADISTICATSCSREMFVSRHSCQEVEGMMVDLIPSQ